MKSIENKNLFVYAPYGARIFVGNIEQINLFKELISPSLQYLVRLVDIDEDNFHIKVAENQLLKEIKRITKLIKNNSD